MALMKLLFSLFKNIFLSSFLLIFFSSITPSFSKTGECSNDEDYMCFYNLAYEKSKSELIDTEYHLTDEEIKFATDNYTKFLSLIEENGYKLSNDILINTYIELARLNYSYTQSSDNENFENILSYIEKAISLGGSWNSWRYCDYAYEYVTWNYSEDLSEEESALLQSYINKSIDYCLSFIDQDQYLPFPKSEPLSLRWNKERKEPLLFLTYYNLLWLYDEILNAQESVKYALLAERQFINKKEVWFDYLENDYVPRLYNHLGWAYSSGYGLPKDYIKSNEYLEKAANLDDYNATSNLGDRYRMGEFVDQDFLMAKYWYEKTLEIYEEDPWTLFHLGEMYHFGWGVDENKNTAKTYFETLSSLYEKALTSPEDYYYWSFKRLEDAAEYAELYLEGWSNGSYKPINDYQVCEEAYNRFDQNSNLNHLVSSCAKLAENNPKAKFFMAQFYASGNEVQKDTTHAYNTTINLIEELKDDNGKYSEYVDTYHEKFNKYWTDYLHIFAFDLITNGDVSNIEPEIAYSIISQVLMDRNNNYAFDKINDPWYLTDFARLARLKIEGWGTTQDLIGAENLLNKLRHKIEFFQNNPDQYDTDLISDEDLRDYSLFVSEVEDRLAQIQSGFDVKSNILLAFPVEYVGKFKWYDGYTHSIKMSLDSPKQIGIDKYLLNGQVDFNWTTGQSSNYLIQGVLDEKTRLISFKEFDSGNLNTFDYNYGAGEYHGHFTEDFNAFSANFVTYDSYSHAHLEVFKKVSNDDSAINDYKKILGIGKQYAVLIGNNDYQNLEQLNTATADARSLADLLEKKYGFNVEDPMIDATRSEILTKLSDMGNILSENDSLLIFYAGHGRQEEITGRGYWSPIDANKQNYINDISNDDITNLLQKIDAKHILVIADTCYSGTLVLRGDNRIENINIKYLKDLSNKYSRKALTSGALQPVSDSGSNGHSAFASSLLRVLANNSEVLTANALHQSIRPEIMNNYKQTPLYNIVASAGDEGGEFLFIPIQ